MKYLRTFEGKYDKMVGILLDDLLEKIKESRLEWEEKPEDENKHKTYHIADYSGTLNNISLYLKIRRHRNPNYREDYEIIGTAWTDDLDENIDKINVNPNKEPQIYKKMIPELVDTIRHEVEHLTQAGKNKLPNKAKISRLKDKISFEENNQHYYYLMSHEIPALVSGLYKRAKWEKKPLDVVFNNFLDWLEEYGVFKEEYKRNLLFKQWYKYAIKHFPDAKWTN